MKYVSPPFVCFQSLRTRWRRSRSGFPPPTLLQRTPLPSTTPQPGTLSGLNVPTALQFRSDSDTFSQDYNCDLRNKQTSFCHWMCSDGSLSSVDGFFIRASCKIPEAVKTIKLVELASQRRFKTCLDPFSVAAQSRRFPVMTRRRQRAQNRSLKSRRQQRSPWWSRGRRRCWSHRQMSTRLMTTQRKAPPPPRPLQNQPPCPSNPPPPLQRRTG